VLPFFLGENVSAFVILLIVIYINRKVNESCVEESGS